MRRGHSGCGGWRSENPRHFGPRPGGAPRFRPPRPFGQPETSRFPPSGHRYRHYQSRTPHLDDRRPPDVHERNSYRGPGHPINQSRSQECRPHDRQILPFMQQQRHNENEHGMYNTNNYYDDKHNHSYNVNNMGDVDHRQTPGEPKNYQKPPQWANPQFDVNKSYYNNYRSPQKMTRDHISSSEGMLNQEYTGHRPPASDHYSATPCPNNNNTPYSRSIDDTVDIVRRRLMNRDTQPLPEQATEKDQEMGQNTSESYQNSTQEQPVKKRVQRQRQNIKNNCNKMKNKIVHQLLKMDKDKIHKLMDNPSSSSKFEYAISSLITESQNSLYRHQRSIAEKSLCNPNTDFIHSDNNTIYEDTFMKQMQCILDPQDTILLEDIKPLVLAELNKVLQLEDFEFESTDDQAMNSRGENLNEIPNEDQYYSDLYYGLGEQSVGSSSNPMYDYNSPVNINETNRDFDEDKPLFERRPRNKDNRNERRISESLSRKSIEKQNEPLFKTEEDHLPLFDSNTEQLSEDDYTFAELDKQYHVPIDLNYMENEDAISNNSNSPACKKEIVQNDMSKDLPVSIKKEIEDFAKSPIKLNCLVTTSETNKSTHNNTHDNLKKEVTTPVKETVEQCNLQTITPPTEKTSKPSNTGSFSPLESMIKSSSPHNSRKRSIDQKPAHRKEKRKKSNGPEPTTGQETANVQKDDKQTPKLSNNETLEPSKGESHKNVKRSDSHRKSKDSESKSNNPQKKSEKSSNTPHSTSLKDHNNSGNSQKLDSKTKLKTIDMFLEQPKKAAAFQPHKNSTQLPPIKSPDENKLKLFTPTAPTTTASFARKLIKRHVGTQVIRKFKDKDNQTESMESCSKLVQTDPVTFSKTKSMTKDPFERMKEIDLEIQVLLQEKFKLYNSLESKDANNANTMETLGMTVLNVPLDNETTEKNDDELSADIIAEDFVNIPVEDLEQIALETVENRESPKMNSRDRRARAIKPTRKISESSITPRRTNRKTPKTPNISLLEQIITDDRPIEDIISLDDLECTPVKSKKKPPKSSANKKSTKKGKITKTITHKHDYDIKECSVILIRTNVSNYLESTSNISSIQDDSQESCSSENGITLNSNQTEKCNEIITEEINEEMSIKCNEIEETVVNDLQFDMLDVSEDIVIGEHCELKNDKDVSEEKVQVTEEVILDNSQSSVEEVVPEKPVTECRIYDYATDENLRRDSLVVNGNADAVLAIECIENEFIAACLDGNVYHFGTDGRLVNTLRGSNHAVTCLTIVKEKSGTTVYTGSLDSRIRYYDLETGLEKGPECNVLSPIQTMDRAWDTVFVGTRTGFVLQFECKNNMLIPVSTVKFSEQSILALRAMKEGPRKVLLVAARSENVTIKDAQTGLLLRSLSGPKMTVYTLLFEDGKVYCGTSSHQIHVFDYASGGHVCSHEGGKGAVCLRAAGGLVFAGCYDGCVYVYRDGESRPIAQLRGPSLMLLSLAVVGSKIIAGYKDRSLYIWKIPLAVLQEMIL